MRKINVRSPYYIEVNEVQKPTLYYALQKCSDSSTGYVSEQEVGDFSPTLENNDRVQDASLNDYTVVGRVDITQGTYTSVGLISDTGEVGCVIPPADLFYKLIKCSDPNSNTTYLSFQKTTDTTLEDGQRVEFGGDYYTISGEAEASEGTKIGYVNIIQGETGCPAVIPPIAPQTEQVNCGGTVNVATDVGVVTYQVNTVEIGTFRVDISGSDVPAKFTLKWNGSEVTTNYIGLDLYDQDLLDAGVPIGEIATSDPSTKASNFLEITKGTQNPELVELVVNAPLVNDEYTLNFTCPVTPPVIVTPTTQINIWFDSSGSMNTTLSPLVAMAQTTLKSCLLPFYNNDSDIYDAFVKVRNFSNERTFEKLATNPDASIGALNAINIVFQDEASAIYYSNSYFFSESSWSREYRTDLENLKYQLDNYPQDYITPIIFQVATPNFELGYKPFLKTVQNGGNVGGAYDSPYNLVDYNDRVSFNYDITPASTAVYYRDLVIQAINDLGFNITCP